MVLCETHFLIIQHLCFHSDDQEVAGAGAPAAAEPSGSSASEAASSTSSSVLAASSSPLPPEEAASSPKEVGVEADRASQVSGSGCTSQASVDDDDDVPITDIYFVSANIPSDNKHKTAVIITSLIFQFGILFYFFSHHIQFNSVLLI